MHIGRTPVIIAIACGILAVVILVIVSSYFFCSCCFIHKKRANVPGGMYRMEESSTTSFHQQQQQTQNQSLLPNNNSSAEGSSNQNSRPIISIQPQQMQTIGMVGGGGGQQNQNPSTFTSGGAGGPTALSPVVRSSSLMGSNAMHHNWNGGDDCEPHQTVFHINSNMIGSSHPSSSIHNNNSHSAIGILPPPARFSSNQNLTSYGGGIGGPLIYGDRSNPREVQKLYEYGPISSPYILTNNGGGEYLPSHQYGPISPYVNHNQYFPSNNVKAGGVSGGGGYCTSTLPSSLRRSGSGSASITSATGGGGRSGVGGPQPLKSILRNPLNPQNSTSSSTSYQYAPASMPGNTTPIRSYTPMSMGSVGGSGGRRVTTEEFDFGESLLASGSGSDEHSYNSYNFPDYSPNNNGDGNGGGGGGARPTSYSPRPAPQRRFSNPTTEYQNDINRLGNDLDPESLSRLIELDLDSKL
ncbi:hypothetical protein Fcan01_09485 [Folsomia candida]|uniref:Uncharacterized protein n=1 Tax=Folsomia candida TaxID=158441 RepID=A0A226EEZ1_FOLCA|nr:hypothetical protein Fcan01_09485 [Folsomia candida]